MKISHNWFRISVHLFHHTISPFAYSWLYSFQWFTCHGRLFVNTHFGPSIVNEFSPTCAIPCWDFLVPLLRPVNLTSSFLLMALRTSSEDVNPCNFSLLDRQNFQVVLLYFPWPILRSLKFSALFWKYVVQSRGSSCFLLLLIMSNLLNFFFLLHIPQVLWYTMQLSLSRICIHQKIYSLKKSMWQGWLQFNFVSK